MRSRVLPAAIRVSASAVAFIVAALICGPTSAAGQSASLQGVATSAETDGPLEGVGIILERGGEQLHRALTDRNGFYQIGGIAAGVYTLRAQRLGHVPYRREVAFAGGARLTIGLRLEPDPLALEALVIAAERGSTVRDLGRQQVTPADLRLVPVPAGSGDLAAYLQTLPGVTTTGDRGGQLFVRGGTSAENLVLVDGIPIYQPFHIVGFFSVFPEDLVSSVDFYAGGFGARYSGRTSSVLDVALRDGNPHRYRVMGSASPFIAEALVEGPVTEGISWMASARRSLIEETSERLLGERQPITFESQLLKVTGTSGDDLRCSALGLRTLDRGRLDPQEDHSYVEWRNWLVGGRCVAQMSGFLRLLESNFSFSSLENSAVSRGSSNFRSSVWRMQHDAHVTTMVIGTPVHAGYHMNMELLGYDLSELYGVQARDGDVFGMSGYVEAALTVGARIEIRPGLVLTASPRPGLEPRLRAGWMPFGRASEKLQAAVGLYRQDVIGTSDMRDVGSVFSAWMNVPDDVPVEAFHALLGWQQSLPGGLRGSAEGYYKRLRNIPVPEWRSVAEFNTRLGAAQGTSYGADVRLEYSTGRFLGFIGYGYGLTEYETSQREFTTWFGDSVQRYHPPHDRRHQVNAVGSLDLAGFQVGARWQFGTGLSFTRPLGFDESFDFIDDIPDVGNLPGSTRLILDRPFNARLPATHRLDLSLKREFELRPGTITAQIGAINAFDRRNMFYYDLYSGRRVDQLPLSPYASITLRSR